MRFVAPQFALEGHFERFLVPVGGAHGRVIVCRVEFIELPLGPQERGISDQVGDDAVITMNGSASPRAYR